MHHVLANNTNLLLLLLLFRSYVRLIDFSVDDLPSSFAPRSELGIWKKSLCSFAAVLARGEATSPRPHVGAKSEERGKQPVGKMASKAAPPPPPLSRTLILPLFLWLHADCVAVGNRMGDDGRVDCDCHDRHKTRSLHFRRTGTHSAERHEQHLFRLTQIARPIKFPRTMRSPVTRSRRRSNHVSRFTVKTSPVMMILKGDRDKVTKSSSFCLLPPDEDEGDERRQLPSSNPEQQQLRLRTHLRIRRVAILVYNGIRYDTPTRIKYIQTYIRQIKAKQTKVQHLIQEYCTSLKTGILY